jgi:hypothetical protein
MDFLLPGDSRPVKMDAVSNVIKIAVTDHAKATISAIAKRHGMKEIAVASRIYTWFASQPDVIQKGVLGMWPEGYEADLAELVVERLAARQKRKNA